MHWLVSIRIVAAVDSIPVKITSVDQMADAVANMVVQWCGGEVP
jgi:hypothetical protein